MDEDREIPIILGRPFMATGRTLIDVQKGELTMRVQDQEVTFNVFKAMKFPTEPDDCFAINMVDDLVSEMFAQTHPIDPLEASIINSDVKHDQEAIDFVQFLDAAPRFTHSLK